MIPSEQPQKTYFSLTDSELAPEDWELEICKYEIYANHVSLVIRLRFCGDVSDDIFTDK